MATKERHEIYKSKKLCPNCGNKTDGKHTFCDICLRKARAKYKLSVYPDGTKKCLDCGEEIPRNDKRTATRCPGCLRVHNNKWSREYYRTHPDKREKVKKYARERYVANKDKIKLLEHARRIKRLYGITFDELTLIYHKQEGKGPG